MMSAMTFPITATLLPTAFLLAMVCAVTLASVFVKRNNGYVVHLLSQASLVMTFYFVLRQYCVVKVAHVFAHESLVVDHLSGITSLCIILLSFFFFTYAKKELERMQLASGEFYILSLFAVLGMIVMTSAYNFVTLFLSVELMSLPIYALCAYQKKSSKGAEAAMKYFVTGALATGLMLYGISLIYGATHSLDFSVVSQVLRNASHGKEVVLLIGIAFLIAGFAFKFGVVPFHMWVPDVYQGSSAIVAMFLSSAPKVAVFALVVRLFYGSFDSLHMHWHHLMTLLAVLSIFIGNVVALVQDNIKRMFAYSSMAHMGYMMLALAAGTHLGLSSALFYVLSYAVVSMGGFAVLAILNDKGYEIRNFSDLAGLNNRHPWIAFMMLLLIFSMAGIPPTVGFIAKFGIVMTMIKTHQVALAVYLVLMSVVGLYYYLRAVKVMYFEKARAKTFPKQIPTGASVAISINGIVVLLLGIFPSLLLVVCQMSFS